ncbi:MAG: hypothetical protein ABSG68_17360 [Thermoguttaceae bacterium]
MRKRIVIAIVVVLLLLVGTTWGLLRRGPSAQLQKVKAMQAALINDGPDADRRKTFEAMRGEMDQLSPAERDAARRDMQASFEKRMDKQMADYAAMKPEERVAYLDKQIAQDEKRAKDRESWQKQRGKRSSGGGSSGSGGSGSGGSGGGGGSGDGSAPFSGSGVTPGTTNGAPAGPPKGGRGRNATIEQKAKMQRQRLNATSPEQRAQRALFITDMNNRRAQYGLPPLRRPF